MAPSSDAHLRTLTHGPHPRPSPTARTAITRSEAQRGARRKGMLVEERVDYLNAIGFEWQGADATAGGSGGSDGGGVVSWYDAGKRLGN